ALADGGLPRPIFRARLAQSILRALIVNLPRSGLLRETYHLLKTARAMETANRPEGRGVSEFNTLFQSGFGAVAAAVIEASPPAPHPEPHSPEGRGEQELAGLLESITGRFLPLWAEYSQTLQLAALEGVRGQPEWEELRAFVRCYGGDLFHARFLTLA